MSRHVHRFSTLTTVELGSTDVARDRKKHIGCSEVNINEKHYGGLKNTSVEPWSAEPSFTVLKIYNK